MQKIEIEKKTCCNNEDGVMFYDNCFKKNRFKNFLVFSIVKKFYTAKFCFAIVSF